MRRIALLILFFPFFAGAQKKNMPMQLDTIFNKWFKPEEPGAAVLLVKDGEVIYQKGFGIEDVHTKKPITTATLFNLGSISKTFVAYGILKLADEKKLSLDDTLYKWFPDFKNRAIAEKVRLYHLLTHSSGIPDSRKVSEQKEFYLYARDEENFAPLKQTDSLLFEPGTMYRSSNPAFNGLALIIEKASGMKWQQYIKEQIFDQCGMKRSTITDGPHPEKGVSHGYIKNEKGNFEELDYGEEPTFPAAGKGGVWSSVEELMKYEMGIQQHLFLDNNWINISRPIFPMPGWKDSIPSRLGLSWFITREMDMNLIGHTGSQGGFISDYCWLPEKKLLYILLCNIPRPIKDIRTQVVLLMKRHNWFDGQ